MPHRMLVQLSEKDFNFFQKLVKSKVGISIRPGKKNNLGVKLAHRLRQLGLTSYFDYYRYLLKPEGIKELRHLINTVAIDTTEFFREERQFNFLREHILPELIQQKNKKQRIRIWSSACSTGQEPYSIAMLVTEMVGIDMSWDIKILATDINTYSLKIAYLGRYSKRQVEDVPAKYLKKYFRKESVGQEEFFQIKEFLKKRLIFRRLNLLMSINRIRGPVDMIFCRNVMIYFDAKTKKMISGQLYHLLRPKGYLCLGLSESLLGIDNQFKLIESSIYRKNG
jgi:chemotaxis protein methyltransferase CheR